MNMEAMAAGRERARKRREREAVKKVRVWQGWLNTTHGDFRTEPPRPTNGEFRMARKAAA